VATSTTDRRLVELAMLGLIRQDAGEGQAWAWCPLRSVTAAVLRDGFGTVTGKVI
jgi:hypothetical protein